MILGFPFQVEVWRGLEVPELKKVRLPTEDILSVPNSTALIKPEEVPPPPFPCLRAVYCVVRGCVRCVFWNMSQVFGPFVWYVCVCVHAYVHQHAYFYLFAYFGCHMFGCVMPMVQVQVYCFPLGVNLLFFQC